MISKIIPLSVIISLIFYSPSINAQQNINKAIVYKKISVDSTISISIPDYLIQTSAIENKTTILFENTFNDTYCKIEKSEDGDESLKNFYSRTTKNLESQKCTIIKTQKNILSDLTEMRILARKGNESEVYVYHISIIKAPDSFIIICFWTKESNSEYLSHFEFAQNTIATN